MSDTYTRIKWVNGESTPLNSDNLNKMDIGILEAHNRLDEVEQKVSFKTIDCGGANLPDDN